MLAFGIYDEFDTLSTSQQTQNVREFVRRSEASTAEELIQQGSRVGVSVAGVLGFSFGGHSAQHRFREWRAEYLSLSEEQLESYHGYKSRVRVVNQALMAQYANCLMQRARPGQLRGWLTTSKDRSQFTCTVEYWGVGQDDAGAKILSVDVIPTPSSSIGLDALRQGTVLNEKETFVCAVTPATTYSVIVKTSKGDWSVTLDGYVEQPPPEHVETPTMLGEWDGQGVWMGRQGPPNGDPFAMRLSIHQNESGAIEAVASGPQGQDPKLFIPIDPRTIHVLADDTKPGVPVKLQPTDVPFALAHPEHRVHVFWVTSVERDVMRGYFVSQGEGVKGLGTTKPMLWGYVTWTRRLAAPVPAPK